MIKLKIALLIVATLAYDLVMIWALRFILAWRERAWMFSLDSMALAFWVMAATPLIVTGYCVSKLAAIRRGENPRPAGL